MSVSLCLFALSGVVPSVANEKAVHVFAGGNDGVLPAAGLIADKQGNLYGTTEEGGVGTTCTGCGTIFKLGPDRKEAVLYAFEGGADGIAPMGPVLMDESGNLYGTTSGGGGKLCNGGNACGTIYKLAPDGTETVLYAFQGQADGWNPLGGLAADASGDLFGTTADGGTFGSNCGTYGCGTVFELQPSGKLITLYAFQGESDGSGPLGGVIMDSAGNLYGTAQGEGACCGVVFEITAGGTYSVLYAFQGGSDGETPQSGLLADASGNLYGTTEVGGDPNCASGLGCGTVFEVPAGGGSDKVLYSFRAGRDGANPLAGVVMDQKGNLYGTTWLGGGQGHGCKQLFGDGCGTVYKLTPSGKETVLYSFHARHGQLPVAPLLLEGNDLYGTTTEGGKYHDGVVFRVRK